mgnify:CR=1 FL=1
MFYDFWEIEDIQAAQRYLTFWYNMVNGSKIFPLIEFTKTIKAHWCGIVNYLKSNITAGIIARY